METNPNLCKYQSSALDEKAVKALKLGNPRKNVEYLLVLLNHQAPQVQSPQAQAKTGPAVVAPTTQQGVEILANIKKLSDQFKQLERANILNALNPGPQPVDLAGPVIVKVPGKNRKCVLHTLGAVRLLAKDGNAKLLWPDSAPNAISEEVISEAFRWYESIVNKPDKEDIFETEMDLKITEMHEWISNLAASSSDKAKDSGYPVIKMYMRSESVKNVELRVVNTENYVNKDGKSRPFDVFRIGEGSRPRVVYAVRTAPPTLQHGCLEEEGWVHSEMF